MNKIIKLFIVLFFLTNTIESDENNTKKIDFLVNECTLKIPYGYNGAVSGDGDIVFAPSFSLHLKDYVGYSVILIEKNATKSLLSNSDLNSHDFNTIGHLKIIRTNTNKSNGYIVGKHFYLYSGNLDHNYTKELINSCNNSWHKDMQIKDIDTLNLKLVKDFPNYFDENQSLFIENKFKAIEEAYYE